MTNEDLAKVILNALAQENASPLVNEAVDFLRHEPAVMERVATRVLLAVGSAQRAAHNEMYGRSHSGRTPLF